MRGICMCVCGPPPGGICRACGAAGTGYMPYPYPWPQPPVAVPTTWPKFPQEQRGLTEDEIRRIIREELARSAAGKSGG